MKKLSVLCSLIMLVLTACGGGGSSSSPDSSINSSGGSNKTIASISVSPSNLSMPVGTPTQFIATGTYPDNTTGDLTTAVTWSSSDPSVATISNDANSKGKAMAVAAGTTKITAMSASGNISGSTQLTVNVVNSTDVSLGGYHHIGDGVWGAETVNTQLAYPLEGKTFNASFVLTDQPQKFAYATITFQHRGVEASSGYKDVLLLNANSYLLEDSNPAGSFTMYSRKVPSSIFLPNQTNTLMIQSANIPWNTADYDDFEFQNIFIQFSN